MARLASARRAPLSLMLAAACALVGCSMVPTYERPPVPTQAAWAAQPGASTAAVPVSADWWQHFDSPDLDALMAEALAANQDIAAAIARIDQARANTRIAGAPLLPNVEATGSTSGTLSHNRHRTQTGSSGEALLTASYEIDLWGKNAAGLEASKHALNASFFDREALALVVQSEVASTYFDAVSLRQRLAIARENLAAAQQVLKLVQIQMAQGAATALDLAQQRTAVATFEAEIPTLEQQLEADQTSLAILLGRAPGGTTVERDKLDALGLPSIAAGQPADLLGRRPDIAEAEANLKAANADIGVARAAFYPSLTLSAQGALSGLTTSGTSTAASIAAGLVAPIFEGGQLEGQLDLTKARKQELVATYRQTVLTSFKEVEDALSTVQTSAARVKSLQTAADQAREAFRLAQLSYSAGASDFLTVLDAQRTLLDNEDSLVQAQRDRFTAAASLFKALGGGWAGSA
jgi:NodT family efflux transporter outer membrane factor (OMF) lipoprotein